MTTSRRRAWRLAAVSAGTALALTPLASAGASPATNPDPAALAPVVGTDAVRVVAGDYIVVLRDGVPADRVEAVSAIATAAGGDVSFTYSAALKGFAATLPDEALAAVRAAADVAFIEADQEVSLPPEAPDGAREDQKNATWGLDRIDQRNLPLNERYLYDFTGAGVTAYIIDTGIRATHDEFGDRVEEGFTSIDDGNGTDDCVGHGTHVAGTVGGTLYGVAKDVTLVPVRVLNCEGSGTNQEVIAGIDWVTANAATPAVANMSLGGDRSKALNKATRESIESGVQYAVAAGNLTADACDYSPASTPKALTVGASDEFDWSAWFSNYGDCLDLWAPGDYITSAYNGSDSDTEVLSGTSMASPHVAGVLALYLDEDPDLTPGELREQIRINSSKNKLFLLFGGPNRLLYSR